MRKLVQRLAGELLALCRNDLARPLASDLLGYRPALNEGAQPPITLCGNDADLVVKVLAKSADLFVLDRFGPLVLLDSLPRKHLHIDHGPIDSRRDIEGGVPDILSLLAEDGTQQPLLRGQHGFPFGGHLPHQDVARPHLGSNPNDPAFVEILQGVLTHVGRIACDLLLPQLGVASLDLKLLDMDGGVTVILDQPFANQDGVLKVIPTPWHEGDQNVLPKGQLAKLGGRSIRDDLLPRDPFTLLDDRPLVYASVLVAAAELHERIDVHPGCVASIFSLAIRGTDDDPLGAYRFDHPATPGHHNRP